MVTKVHLEGIIHTSVVSSSDGSIFHLGVRNYRLEDVNQHVKSTNEAMRDRCEYLVRERATVSVHFNLMLSLRKGDYVRCTYEWIAGSVDRFPTEINYPRSISLIDEDLEETLRYES